MLEIDDKEEIKNEFDEFCNKNQLCLFKVEKKEKKELGEGVLIEELTKKCTSFCENNKALLEKCQSFRASNLDEFCKEYKVEVDRALKLLNFQVEANKRASGRKIDLEEKAIDLEEKANEKQVLTIKKELLRMLHDCYSDSKKNVTNVLNIWRPLVLNINKKKEEWLFKEINQTEKNNIEKMSLFDWVWYLQYKSFCQSNEKSDYWRNYMERCLPLIIFLDGPWAILNFCLLGLSKTSLSVWIFNCGAFHFFFNLRDYSLNSVDELTSFQNSRRELFLDMLEEEGKKMEEESKIKE